MLLSRTHNCSTGVVVRAAYSIGHVCSLAAPLCVFTGMCFIAQIGIIMEIIVFIY